MKVAKTSRKNVELSHIPMIHQQVVGVGGGVDISSLGTHTPTLTLTLTLKSDSCKKNASVECNSNFPKNQFIQCQSSCVLKQHVRRSWTSDIFKLILNDEMNLT